MRNWSYDEGKNMTRIALPLLGILAYRHTIFCDNELSRIAKCVLQTLELLHRRRIAHRDVKGQVCHLFQITHALEHPQGWCKVDLSGLW
jgi:serine/threonine protein kinase